MPAITGNEATGTPGFIRVTGGDVLALGTGDTTTEFTIWLRVNAATGDANTKVRAGVVALYSVGQPPDPDLTTYTSKLTERKVA